MMEWVCVFFMQIKWVFVVFGMAGVHNKEAHKSPDSDVVGVFKDDTKLWLKCYLTC